MNIFGKLLLILMLCMQAIPALSTSHRKIQYTVEIYNRCKNPITNLNIQYDGKALFPDGGSRDLGYHSSRIYDMPMIMPDIARVTWRAVKETKYEEHVPLRSLIRMRDYFGREFRINFHVCNDELHVVFGNRSRAQIEYKFKEIWNNQNDNDVV